MVSYSLGLAYPVREPGLLSLSVFGSTFIFILISGFVICEGSVSEFMLTALSMSCSSFILVFLVD